MERNKSAHYFLIGLLLATAATAALVGWWLWRRRQEEQAAFAPRPSRPPSHDDASADPLQEIRGIGDVYARRLRAAGIRTFADLAALTPDEARAFARAQPWQADAADWIEQAKELASS